MNWFQEIADRLRDYADTREETWSDGMDILFHTEDAARAFVDILWQLYASQDEDVTIKYGYYDPEADKRSGEEDRFTGWWYVSID